MQGWVGGPELRHLHSASYVPGPTGFNLNSHYLQASFDNCKIGRLVDLKDLYSSE